MFDIIKITGGLCWSIVYIALIYNAFKYKKIAIPFIALALNFSWEAIYSFHEIDILNISMQRSINLFWFMLDLVILYQYLIYGIQDFPKKLSAKLFLPWSFLILFVAFVVEYQFLIEFEGIRGAIYSAFLQNLIMSILFIALLIKRDDIKDLSYTVAIAKWIGTLTQTIVFGAENEFIFTIGLLCSLIDICYIFLLFYLKSKK